jgi:hypothetical protein
MAQLQPKVTKAALAHDPVCRDLPRRADCRTTDTTIELDSFRCTHPAEGAPKTGFLCGDVPNRTMECPNPQEEDRLHALRADRPFQET